MIFASCNNKTIVPFPEHELGHRPPVTKPLEFSKTQPLSWDTIQSGGIQPAISKLDIDALKALPFDTTGFQPFAQPPKEVRFQFNTLPEKDFSLEALETKPLNFTTTILPPPVTIKSTKPGLQKGLAITMYDMGVLQGLTAKFIGAVLKDSKGLLWIGSVEGLYTYDGQFVRAVLPGISGIPIVGITEDKNGNIWITSVAGISMVNLAKGILKTSTNIIGQSNNLAHLTTDSKGNIWTYNAKDNSVAIIDPEKAVYKKLSFKDGLADSVAYDIVEDNKKRIWISTYSNGINIIDPEAKKIKQMSVAQGLASKDVSALTVGETGEIYVGNADGLDVIDTDKGTIKQFNKLQGLEKIYTLGIAAPRNGHLWRNTIGGLEVIDLVNGTLRHINTKSGLNENIVTAAVPDEFNRVWVGTTGGLKVIEQYAKTSHWFNNLNIISLMEDAVGNLWVASNQGIIIVNAKRNAMRLLKEANGLSNNFVQSFTRSNGNMIVATNGGYNIINPVAKTILKVGKKQGFPKDTIYAVFRDKQANTWFTGPDAGIALFDSVKNMVMHTDKKGGLSADEVLDLRQDTEGKYWLVTQTGGVNIIDREAGTVSYLDSEAGLQQRSNKTILIDKYGRVWIGTFKGIYIADTKAKTLTHITTEQGLSNNKVLSLLEYKGSICAGTETKISMITAPLPGSKTDTAWKIAVLKGSEGISKVQQSWSSDCITSRGEYLWGDAGVTLIDTIAASGSEPATFIAGINIMNQPQFFAGSSTDTTTGSIYADNKTYKWDAVKGIHNMPENLVIPHNKNYLQFQYGEASLGRQDSIWYVYTLQGIDKSWSAPTINTITENYLNLPAGEYIFKVSSKYTNGNWSEPATLRFVISPPWYQSWWAYTLYALLAASVLRAYIVYRSRQLQKENRVLEEKVALRTNQLQKSLEDLKATQTQLVHAEKMASLGELTAGIAHEIQNPLNFINNFSEVNAELLAEMKEELLNGNMDEVIAIAADISSNEEKIMQHGKRADAIVKGMLQHSRSNNGIKEPTDVNALCDEYLRLSYHGLRAKDKSFNASLKTDFDTSIGSIKLVTQDIGRVILNLYNNAFYAVSERHSLEAAAGNHFEPTVSVCTKNLGDKVEISVRDNGKGIPKNITDKIFQPFFTTKPSGQGTGLGLSLSYDIIKAHGGQINVSGEEGKGTTFTILLPK